MLKKLGVLGINIFAIQFAVFGDEIFFEKWQKLSYCLIEKIIFSKFGFLPNRPKNQRIMMHVLSFMTKKLFPFYSGGVTKIPNQKDRILTKF